MSDRAEEVFKSAVIYRDAATLLNQSAGGGNFSMFLPSIVNAALAIELAFKSLYLVETGNDFKVDGRYSHDFAALLEQLPESTRAELTASFNRRCEARDMSDIDQLDATTKTKTPRSLDKLIKGWSTIFVQARYVYDMNKTKPMSAALFPEVMDSLFSAILARRETWIRWAPNWRPK